MLGTSGRTDRKSSRNEKVTDSLLAVKDADRADPAANAVTLKADAGHYELIT